MTDERKFGKSVGDGSGLVWIHDAEGKLVKGTVFQLNQQVRKHQEDLRSIGITTKKGG